MTKSTVPPWDEIRDRAREVEAAATALVDEANGLAQPEASDRRLAALIVAASARHMVSASHAVVGIHARHVEVDAALAEAQKAWGEAKDAVAKAPPGDDKKEAACAESDTRQLVERLTAITAGLDERVRRCAFVLLAIGGAVDEDVVRAAPSLGDDVAKVQSKANRLRTRVLAFAKLDPVAASVSPLLKVAAMDQYQREWFPVDPELNLIRHTALDPVKLTPPPEPEEKPKDAADESFDVLLKKLLVALAK